MTWVAREISGSSDSDRKLPGIAIQGSSMEQANLVSPLPASHSPVLPDESSEGPGHRLPAFTGSSSAIAPPQDSALRPMLRNPEVQLAARKQAVPERDETAIQRLVIPSLEVDARVVLKPFTGLTWDITGLRTDVAWLEGTAHPGSAGNTVLAGHIMVLNVGRGPFRFLDRLKDGAIVYVYTGKNVYRYRVREQVVVNETDSSVIADTGAAQLTLLTCSNWSESLGDYVRRRAVFADLVRVTPADGGEIPSKYDR